MIQFLGNMLKEIEEYYWKVLRMDGGSRYLNPDVLDVFHPKASRFFVDAPYFRIGSYFRQIVEQSADTRHWHMDGAGDPKQGMIISSYPKNTYLLETKVRPYGRNAEVDDEIHELIKTGYAKIIVPDPGDVYLVSEKIYHRTNLETCDNHMCLRTWLRRSHS